jgi:hypothetical protein
VGPRVGLDTETTGKILSPLPGIEPRSLGLPVRSQTLYCLSYPAPTFVPVYKVKSVAYDRLLYLYICSAVQQDTKNNAI